MNHQKLKPRIDSRVLTANALDSKLAISIAEAAEALSLSEKKIENLIAEGEIRSIKIGRSRRIVVESLMEWLSHLEQLEYERQFNSE